MSQAERLMAIIDRLCKRDVKLNTKWIVDEFEISDRQARRDIEYIRDRIINTGIDSDIELIYDRANNEYRLTGSQEKLEALFAKSVIASAVAESSIDPLREIFGLKEKSSRFSKVRYISQASEPPDYTIFMKILQSIEDCLRVEIDYENMRKVRSIRVVEPLELINYSAIWYMRAYDSGKKELRTFSLSRVKGITLLKESQSFKDYDYLKKEDISGYGILTGGEIQQYTIHFHGDVARAVSNQIWHVNQKGRWIDSQTYELSLPAASDTELVSKTLYYGDAAEPIAPESFVNKYRECVERLFVKLNIK